VSSVLDIRGLTKSHGARVLFRDADLSVAPGEKVGVIGGNGSGKSTLFRILAGLEGYEEGSVALRRGLRVGYLPQDPDMDPEATVFEAAAEGRNELHRLLARYHEVNRELGEDPAPHRLEELLSLQASLSSRIEAAGGWRWGHRVEEILTRLGVSEWERRMGALSGGERRRVALARTLLSDPELLLLDEPTNHLDAETVLWLEETLWDFAGTVLVITHDRYFLDRVVDRVVEVSHHGLVSYDGGYTEYLEARTVREERARTEEQKRARLLEKELAWARRSPPARTGKQKARRARAAELAREERARDRTRSGEVTLELQDGPRLGSRILELHDVGKRYGDQVVLDGFSDRLLAGERVGVVGPNGCGKSTLLRIIVGEEEPDEGRVVLGENTLVGYLDQLRELDPELTVARAVSPRDWVEVGGRRVHLRAYLDRFLFPPHVQEQRVGALSGGERNRVLLARLFLERFNLLVLDEPTNDLDLDTLRVLEDAIESFEGCVLVVTHDRFLLDKLATSLLVFEGEGRVRRHHGSWDAYLTNTGEAQAAEAARAREQERARRQARAREARDQAREARSNRPRLTYGERRELAGMEERIGALEASRDELGARLGDPDFYRDASEEVARVSRRFQEMESELEALYERWMELEERAEGANHQPMREDR
jgi:ABC transport system ATP-binding/permease protein